MPGANIPRSSGLTREQRRLARAMATPLTERAIWGRLKILRCPGIEDLYFDSSTKQWQLRDQFITRGSNHRWAFIRPMHAHAIMRDLMAKWLGEPLPDLVMLANKIMELEVRQRAGMKTQGEADAV